MAKASTAKQTPEALIAAGRLAAAKRAPYMRGIMVMLVPIVKEKLGTVAVSEHAEFFYDPAFVDGCSVEEAATLLGHECLHLWLNFFERVKQQNLDPKLANMAQDLVINPILREMGFVFPKGDKNGIFPKDFNFPEGLSMGEYYQLLQKNSTKISISHKLLGGHCGGCAGNPNPDAEGEKGKGGKSGEGGGGKDDDHAQPGTGIGSSGDGRTEGQIMRALKSAAEEARDKSRGNMPAGLQRLIEMTLAPPTIPWRAALRTVVRNGVVYRPGATVMRYDAPSRRQAGLGYGLGAAILPRFRDTSPRVLFAVDTSGSMGASELRDVIPEVRGVIAEVGAKMRMIACDAAVHVNQEIQSVEDFVKNMKGGGGTDFRPVFAALEKMPQHERPNVVIFYTDGYGPAPECAPSWCKVIWLYTRNHQKPCEWGDHLVVGVDSPEEEAA